MSGLLEERWLTFNDSEGGGTEWINEKGEKVRLRKAGNIDIKQITDAASYYCLLPEFYLRPFEPNYITLPQFKNELREIEGKLKSLAV